MISKNYKRNKKIKKDYFDILMSRTKRNGVYVPSASPWPFLAANSIFGFLFTTVVWFHYFEGALKFLLYSAFVVGLVLSFWFKDLIIESQYMGVYMKQNTKYIRTGFALFLVSEFMFFFALFWAYFHFSLVPSVWIGGVWPPHDFPTISAFGLPFLNTVILVTSGFTLTLAQKIIIENRPWARHNASLAFLATIALAFLFLAIQAYEFSTAPFSINDSVYGSIFFFITGFHGLHVIIGTIFLIVIYIRFLAHHFYVENTTALECAAWYWHFVDVIWIFVFVVVYWWGGH